MVSERRERAERHVMQAGAVQGKMAQTVSAERGTKSRCNTSLAQRACAALARSTVPGAQPMSLKSSVAIVEFPLICFARQSPHRASVRP